MAKMKKGKIAPELIERALPGIGGIEGEEAQRLSPEELLEQAELLASDYDYFGAAAHYKAALMRSGGAPEVVEAFVEFLVDQAGWVDEALALFSVEGCVGSERCRRLYARSLTLAGHDAHALEQWSALNASTPDEESLTFEVRIRLKAGFFREAVAPLERLKAEYPAFSELRDLEKLLRDGMATFWEAEVAEVEAEIARGTPAEVLMERFRGWVGLPGQPAQAGALRARVEGALQQAEYAGAMERARDLFRAGEYSQALDVLSDVRRRYPEDVEALLLLDETSEALERQTEGLVRAEAQGKLNSLGEAPWILWLAGSGLREELWRPIVSEMGVSWLLGEWETALEQFGANVSLQQLEAVIQLRRVDELVDSEMLDEAEVILAGVSTILGGSGVLQQAQGRVQASRLAQRRQQATAMLSQARTLFLEGNSDRAAEVVKRILSLEGVEPDEEVRRLESDINETLRLVRDTESARRRLESLLEAEDFFAAMELLESPSGQGLRPEELARGVSAAKAGIGSKWPTSFRRVAPASGGPEYHSEGQGITGIPSDATLRLMIPAPGAECVVLSSGTRLWLVNVARMEIIGEGTLPDSVNLDDNRGVLLGDMVSPEEGMLLYLHLGNNVLLDYRWNSQGVRLNNAGALSAFLPPSKGGHTRWFAPLAKEERFVVCQSAREGQDSSRLISVPLARGKSVLDVDSGFPLGHVRRLAQTDNLFVVHRHPNPVLMRQGGYFSFAFMDDRFKLTERFHIAPAQLDNVLVEATRWIRIGADGQKIYALFSYFEGMTGQQISRPLAFVAMERSGSLLYAVSDSSTLVQDQGDIEPTAEVIEWRGRDYMACVARKADSQALALVDLATFKLVKRWECPNGERLLALVRGYEPGTVICMSLVRSSGALRMRRHALAEVIR